MKTNLRLSALTFFGFEINSIIDHGHIDSITFDDVYRELAQANLIQFLQSKFSRDIDLSIFLPDEEQGTLLMEALRRSAEAFRRSEGRKTGVESSGLCLLMAFCLEAIQDYHRSESR